MPLMTSTVNKQLRWMPRLKKWRFQYVSNGCTTILDFPTRTEAVKQRDILYKRKYGRQWKFRLYSHHRDLDTKYIYPLNKGSWQIQIPSDAYSRNRGEKLKSMYISHATLPEVIQERDVFMEETLGPDWTKFLEKPYVYYDEV